MRLLMHHSLCPLAAVVCMAVTAAPGFSQSLAPPAPVIQLASMGQADLHGIVQDDRGEPLAGAVISALGSATVFAISDTKGRFALRKLPLGPYLIRARLQGYLPPRAQLVDVNRTHTIPTLALTRRAPAEEPVPPVLAAGLGTPDVAATSGQDPDNHDHGEVAWRLRHLKRSVLKEATTRLVDADSDRGSFLDDSLTGLSRAVGTPAKFASSLIGSVPWDGQLDLLTTSSFDRPQDLFSAQTWLPHGIAFLSLEAPGTSGRWAMSGAATQGDLSSWFVSGSFTRAPGAEHQYEAGMSYGMQRYAGGNAEALAAVSDGSRNVGILYAYDDWTIAPRLSMSYGAKYSRYDYLARQGLFSPRASITVTPTSDASFHVRATVSRRGIAPGAEEFNPPSTGPWLPPERTFSALSPRRGFTPEQIDHVELAAEREWSGQLVVGVRAFRQRVDDQLVTMFGIAFPGTTAASLGHYYVATAGDVDAHGWGMSVSRTMSTRLRASIDYTRVASFWVGDSADAAMLSIVALSALRSDEESFHDVTASIESRLPVTDTRLFVIYKVNSGFAAAGAGGPGVGSRFNVQLNQSLPFLRFSNAQWEMLLAVRNLFREEPLDASVYDELLVVRPPKRVVGGVTVRF